jgi:hypothetical protein
VSTISQPLADCLDSMTRSELESALRATRAFTAALERALAAMAPERHLRVVRDGG